MKHMNRRGDIKHNVSDIKSLNAEVIDSQETSYTG